jgi:MoxR-like ATPase
MRFLDIKRYDYPDQERHRQSLTAKGRLDKRLHYPKLVDSLASDEELYEHIKYFYTYPAGVDPLEDLIHDTGELILFDKTVAGEEEAHTLCIEFEGGYRIRTFITNYIIRQRRGKIDNLLKH